MKRLAILIALLVGTGVTFAVIRSGSDDPGQPATALSSSDSAMVQRFVEHDPLLRRVLGDHAYTFKTIGRWEGRALRNRRKLAFLTPVELAIEPSIRKLDARWPYFGSRDYRLCKRYWIPLTVYDLRSVRVFVDLPRHSVAAIVPNEVRRFENWNVPSLPPTCSS